MGNGTAAVLEPTYTGYVASTQDALILFEACLTGVLHHVPRRPHDRERNHLVRSGSVFIYEENASGIKRWTDGVTWSPSRILGNFLVYRELDKPFPPGEKKRAMKKGNRRPQQATRPGEPYPRPESNGPGYSPTTSSSGGFGGERTAQSEVERALVGSLVDSYGFKDSGLVKKTMSVTVSGVTHHLVSYYSVEDVMRGVLQPPSMVEQLRYIRPRAELTSKQSFRAPIDDLEGGMEDPNDPSQALYGYRPSIMTGQGYPVANPGYYAMTGSPYGAHPPQSGPLTGYPVGPPPLPNHATTNPYIPGPPTSSHVPPKSEDYSSFRQPSYGAPFESNLPQNSISSTIPSSINSAVPNSAGDRSHSQSSASPVVYRNHNPPIPPRTVGTDGSPVDTPTHNHYPRSSFSVPGGLDSSHTQPAPPPIDSVPRRESNALPPSYYPSGGSAPGSDRPHFYMGGTSAAPTQYAAQPPMSTWGATTTGQPQI